MNNYNKIIHFYGDFEYIITVTDSKKLSPDRFPARSAVHRNIDE